MSSHIIFRTYKVTKNFYLWFGYVFNYLLYYL